MAAEPRAGVTVIDLHGKNVYQARITVEAALRRSAGVYRLRLIHGHNLGTKLRDMLRETYAADPRVLRAVPAGEDATELVLREYVTR